jgi:hypothetical protein
MSIVQINLPAPHPAQKLFTSWSHVYPKAQVLIAPCGTKFGKSFGCSLWLVIEALTYKGLYCTWIAPTYYKSQIGYRYIKAMLPDIPQINCVDSKLEIHLPNGSFIKFLHGKDAETTVEGDPIDRFVIDESGKQTKQLWYSLLTTITQTRGKGIITGTPRGYTWYYDEYKNALTGDDFYVAASFPTEKNPFVEPEAISRAKKILPPNLFAQYYMAEFVSESEVFGDLTKLWMEDIKLKQANPRWWFHPDPLKREGEIYTGWDIAKTSDYSVFTSVNGDGNLVGYARFNKISYPAQVDRLEQYLTKFFPKGEHFLRYDATGVGTSVGDIIIDKDLDASITPVVFSNKSKAEMVTKLILAIEQGWFKAPKIVQLESELGSYGVTVSKSGLFSYAAEDGEHDDVVSSLLMSVSAAYQNSRAFAEADFDESVFEDEENQDLDIMADAYTQDNFFTTSEESFFA